jgi:hypothetical protein
LEQVVSDGDGSVWGLLTGVVGGILLFYLRIFMVDTTGMFLFECFRNNFLEFLKIIFI